MAKLTRNPSGWGSVLVSAPGSFSGVLGYLQVILPRSQERSAKQQQPTPLSKSETSPQGPCAGANEGSGTANVHAWPGPEQRSPSVRPRNMAPACLLMMGRATHGLPTSVRCLVIIPSHQSSTDSNCMPSRTCSNVITFWKFPVSLAAKSPWAPKHQNRTPVVKLSNFLPTVW